jgi:hypothetical protein
MRSKRFQDRHKHAAGALTLAVIACAFALPARGERASEALTSQPASTTPVVGPIAYYVASCARCHGDITATYVGLQNPKRGKELEQIIDDMAYGPAQAPLDAEGLKQQTALHEAMFGKTPFVWLDPTAKDRLRGEVLPGTTLTFQPATGEVTKPAVTDNRFDFPKQSGTLIGSMGGKEMKIAVH